MIKLYHISENDSLVKLTPRIPSVNNKYISAGYENNMIPRICACESIQGCLTALMDYVKPGNIYYVYEFSVDDANVITTEEISRNKWVPCAHLSKEVWVTCEVRPILVTKIEVIRSIKTMMSRFTYNGKVITHYAEKWKYKKIPFYLSERLLYKELGGEIL